MLTLTHTQVLKQKSDIWNYFHLDTSWDSRKLERTLKVYSRKIKHVEWSKSWNIIPKKNYSCNWLRMFISWPDLGNPKNMVVVAFQQWTKIICHVKCSFQLKTSLPVLWTWQIAFSTNWSEIFGSKGACDCFQNCAAVTVCVLN